VTRGTRPKKPSSSRSFARGARGAWGSQGLKTKILFSFFKTATTTKKRQFFILFYFFERLRPHEQQTTSAGEGRGRGGEERGGNKCVYADAGYVRADVGLRPRERTGASARTRSRPHGLECFISR
jgi:hypothetical protein